MPDLVTERDARVMLAACRMLRMHLGARGDVVHDGDNVLAAVPGAAGYAELSLFRTDDVMAWYAAVSRGPTETSRTLREAMREYEHLLRPF